MIQNSFVYTIRKRISLNKNAILTIVGETGSGKSYGGLRLGEMLDKDFSIDRVCFTPYEFLKLIDDHLKGVRKLPAGSVILVDEAGVQYSARAWQSFHNKVLGLLSQSFRSLNWIVIFTLPSLGWFEKQARQLTHFVLIADHIDYRKNMAYFKLIEMSTNPISGEIQPHYPLKRKASGELEITKFVTFKKPSDALSDAYEQKKLEWQTKRYGSITELMSKVPEGKLGFEASIVKEVEKQERREKKSKKKEIEEALSDGMLDI